MGANLQQVVDHVILRIKLDPRWHGWNDERAWMHIRDVTGIGPNADRDGYLQQVADRARWTLTRPTCRA